MRHLIEPEVLTQRWQTNWSTLAPIGYEVRGAADGHWVRFHTLPESKRYPDSKAEYDEILSRHNTLLKELVATTHPETALIIVSTSWSDSSHPVPLERDLLTTLPNYSYWRSELTDTDEDEEFWTHVYTSVVDWRLGALDDLLTLVADWVVDGIIVAPLNFEWLYHPYDGGADVVVDSFVTRDALRARYQTWLSAHPLGL